MSNSLDLERFRQLAESYGGDVERWPETVRLAARTTTREHWAVAILDEAKELDAMLSVWEVPAMTANLGWQASKRAEAAVPTFMRKVKIWWATLGIAAALSGAAAGTVVTVLLGPPTQNYSSTIFGDLDDGDN